MGDRRLFTGHRSTYHVLNARVVTDAGEHRDVSVEVRDGTATVRRGATVLEQRAGVTETWAHDPQTVDIRFEDGTVWETHRTQRACCGG